MWKFIKKSGDSALIMTLCAFQIGWLRAPDILYFKLVFWTFALLTTLLFVCSVAISVCEFIDRP